MDRAWIQVTPSEFSWERDALAFLKQRLPDHEPYRAWANFEFVLDGSIGEVDALVVSPKGVFLIEIKSWPGELRGRRRHLAAHSARTHQGAQRRQPAAADQPQGQAPQVAARPPARVPRPAAPVHRRARLPVPS